MNTTAIGRFAEDDASSFLKSRHFEILARNWRGKRCEIDIVARKNLVVHIVEVKYRKDSRFGPATDYITPSKMSQLQYAAACWAQANDWDGDIAISIIAIDENGLKFISDVD